MRKLKLQVQMSIDGFVCGPNGEMDWMKWQWDDKLKEHVNNLTDSVGSIILGSGMAPGFIEHWTNAIKTPEDESFDFAKKMIAYPKTIFSKKLKNSDWENTVVENAELKNTVMKMKELPGKDIIVYGGAGFNASLVKENLIDEYNLFVNPTAIGNGMSIFKHLETKLPLVLTQAVSFQCGIVLMQYRPS